MPKSERAGKVILWPAYFDSNCSRAAGRRAPKKSCVPAPNLDALVAAAEALKLKFVAADKAYPGHWWRRAGCIIVEKGGRKKTVIVQALAKALKETWQPPKK